MRGGSIVQIRNIIYPVLPIFLALSLPVTGYGGIIRTGIATHYKVEESGEIVMSVEITNTGNTTAYNTTATVFLDNWADKYDGLGDNRPAGKIHVESRYHNPELKPGRYAVVVRVTFEEQSGVFHRVYHIFSLSYPKRPIFGYQPRLSLRLEQPRFNIRSFWGRKEDMRLFMKNGFDQPVKPLILFYLPDGLTTDEPFRYYELDPAEERVEEIPLVIHRSELQDRRYYLVVSYEHDGIHYSEQVEGKVGVEERPVMFRAYIFFCLGALFLLFACLYLHGRKSRSSVETNRL